MTKKEITNGTDNNNSLTQPLVEKSQPHDKNRDLKQKLRSLVSTKKRRILVIAAAVILAVLILLAIPTTRYAITGVFIKKNAVISVVDSVTGKPVSEASVLIDGKTKKTNGKGEVIFLNMSAGRYKVSVEKKYFQSGQQDVMVPILSSTKPVRFSLKATGRQVLVKVVNKISGAPIEKATVEVSGTKATTDKNGEAAIALPISTKPQTTAVSREGFNGTQLSLVVTSAANQKQDVGLTPVGQIYYLSKRTGKINVMKSQLDGANPQVIVEGTGKENQFQTVLLSSTDWKYSALHVNRGDSDKPKIYLVDADGKLKVMDESNGVFDLVGWSGHQFIYKLTWNTPHFWDSKRQVLKSFNAETGKSVILDETEGGGVNEYTARYQTIEDVFILNDALVFVKNWQGHTYSMPDIKPHEIIRMGASGQNRKNLAEYRNNQFAPVNARLYKPNEIFFRVSTNRGAPEKVDFYEYADGKYASTNETNDLKYFSGEYPTYLISPSEQKTLWSEPRDGKNVIFVGDKDGENGHEIGSGDYVPYGWYSDDYILFSKNGSELYIMSQNGKISADKQALKVTDYHRSNVTFPGYGQGYGGQ